MYSYSIMTTPQVKPETYVFRLGKHKGKLAADVEQSYLTWITKQTWFRDTEIVKQLIKA